MNKYNRFRSTARKFKFRKLHRAPSKILKYKNININALYLLTKLNLDRLAPSIKLSLIILPLILLNITRGFFTAFISFSINTFCCAAIFNFIVHENKNHTNLHIKTKQRISVIKAILLATIVTLINIIIGYVYIAELTKKL